MLEIRVEVLEHLTSLSDLLEALFGLNTLIVVFISGAIDNLVLDFRICHVDEHLLDLSSELSLSVNHKVCEGE